jgi:hypothetical protein
MVLRAIRQLITLGVLVGGATACGAAPSARMNENDVDLASSAGTEVSPTSVDDLTDEQTEPTDEDSAPETSLPTKIQLSAREPEAWQVRDNLQVSLAVPNSFVNNPRDTVLADVDIANGLFVLESWLDKASPMNITLAVQLDPGDGAPMNAAEYDVLVERGPLLWGLQLSTSDSPQPQRQWGYSRFNGYLIVVSGAEASVKLLIDSLTLTLIDTP